MFVLLAGRRGCDKVGNVLGEIAMILSPVLIDRLLDVLPLFCCALSAYSHMAPIRRDVVRLSKPVRQILSP